MNVPRATESLDTSNLTPEFINKIANLPGGREHLMAARTMLRDQRDKQAREMRMLLDRADAIIKSMDLALDGLAA